MHPAVWPQQTWTGNREGKLGPHLTQCGRGQGLPPCQVSSWSIQPFDHNAPTSQTRQIDIQDRQRSDNTGRTVSQTVNQNHEMLATVVQRCIIIIDNNLTEKIIHLAILAIPLSWCMVFSTALFCFDHCQTSHRREKRKGKSGEDLSRYSLKLHQLVKKMSVLSLSY